MHIGLNLEMLEIVGDNFDFELLTCIATGMPRLDNFEQVNTFLFAIPNRYLNLIIGL